MPSGGSSSAGGGGGGGGDYMHTFIIAGILIVLAIVILVYVQSDVFGLSGGASNEEAVQQQEEPPPHVTDKHGDDAPPEGFANYYHLDHEAKQDEAGHTPAPPAATTCPPSSTSLPLLQSIQQKHTAEVVGASASDEHSAPSPSSTAPPANAAAAAAASPSPPGMSACDPSQKLTPQDLLPNDTANTLWAISCPPVPCGDESTASLLQAGKHIGINSVGNSLRNANLQLRSEPANPQVLVSPWLNSTIGPDLHRLPLDATSSC